MNKDLLFNKLSSSKRLILIGLLTLCTCFGAWAQNRQISGKVTSADGDAIPGASIVVKGTGTGTTTDAGGTYKLSVPTNAVLLVRFVGYTPQEVSVGSSNVYNVKLLLNTTNLAEVAVVGIGYGTARRQDLTGSISSIGAAAIASRPVTSLDQAIQGRAAGVQVTNNDGSPGSNATVLIRGIGSLAGGGNDPLYVVDGFALAGGMDNFNPNDIATIDILKDASATAIYGIRAANGVVIVTTKRGRKDGTTVTLDAYNAFQSKPKEYQILDAQQWATLANEVADADPQKNFAELPQWRTPSSLTTADWQNALYRTALTQGYTLAIRGGSDKAQASTSVGYYDQKGIVLGSYYKRITLGLNLDYQPIKWLKSVTSAKYTYKDANNPYGTNSLVNLTELIPTLDGGNKLTNQIKDDNGNYGFYNPINTYTSKYGNPVYSIESNQYQNISQNILANTSLEATILDGLKIKTSAGVNIGTYNGSYFQPEDNRLVNQYGSGAASTQNAFYNQNLNNSFEWQWDNTLSYNKTFGKHTVNFVAGVTALKNTFASMGGSVIPPNSIIRDLNQGTNLKLNTNGNGQSTYTLASQFARLNYSFADRYFITGTIRQDGSSKFEDGHQYGVFPSGSVAWKVKNESFLKNADWISELKFRGSYGKVGNERSIGLFQYQSLYSTGSAPTSSGNLGYPFNKAYQPGVASSQPANPDLRWETDVETDIGMDAAFLHGDLTVTVDWFNRQSEGFLLNLAAPAQTGYTSLTKNIGSMENKGFEFAANYTHRINDFRFDLGLTLSFIRNKLTSITSGTTFVTNFGGLGLQGLGWSTFTETNIGQPVGEFYGYQSLGIFQTQAQVNALNAAASAKTGGVNAYYQKTGTGPGDRYFADTNGDGFVNANDQISLGSPQPKFFGGFTMGGSYKSWDFNAFFNFVYGNKILNYQKSALQSFQNRGFVGVQNVSLQYYQNHWTPSNPSNIYSRATYNDDAIGSNVPSTAWVEDGSFMKLKNLTVGYTLPGDLLKKLLISKVRVYASSQNLFTITNYSGLDPEIGIQNGNATQNGVDNGTYPSSRYYTLGLNVTF
jgi:TonB-linked SusC/RagA family outer membrane protein